MDNKLHYAHTFFCGHLAAVGRASEVQAADKRWQAEKPLTREAYERLSSIYYESFIDSLMQVDGQTSGAVYADTAHLTLETDRSARCATQSSPPRNTPSDCAGSTSSSSPTTSAFSPWRSPKSLKRRSTR